MSQNTIENELKVFQDYFASPESFTNIQDMYFWNKYKHGLYLSAPDNQGNRYYYLPISAYLHPNELGYVINLDDDDDEDDYDETVIPLLYPHPNDPFQHAAIYYADNVYLKKDSSSFSSPIQHYINFEQKDFILKSSPYFKYKIKPLSYINPELYVGAHFFRDREILFLMRNVGKNLSEFLMIQPNLPPHLIDNIISKIIQLVKEMHDKSIVHTDLKLENICIELDKDGAPNLNIIDFDDAYMPEYNTRRPEIIPGTFTFYAPELFKKIPLVVNHFLSFMAFQELAFHIIDKTATPEHMMAIEIESQKSCDLCRMPPQNNIELTDNTYKMSPRAFMHYFIRENFNDIIGIETDLFALGCMIHLLLTHHPEPEQSPFYTTMATLLSHHPTSRRQF